MLKEKNMEILALSKRINMHIIEHAQIEEFVVVQIELDKVVAENRSHKENIVALEG